MAKQLVFANEAQYALKRGVDALASAVATLAGLAFATEPIEVGAYAGLGYGKELKSLFAYRAYAAYAKKTGLYAKAGVDGVGSQLTLYARPGYNFGLVGVNGLYEQTSFKLDGSRRYIDRYGVEVPLFLTEKLTLTPQVSYGNDLHRIGFGGLISVGF